VPLPSAIDDRYLALSREHITAALRKVLEPRPDGRILEIGPKLRWPGFETLDISSTEQPTYVADITKYNPSIPSDRYDIVICISVLEHTLEPVKALAEIRRLMRDGGLLVAQAPLNFRQHGPQPDMWRFTHNGWKYLLRDWDDVQIDALDTPERTLFPIAYMVTARCNKAKIVLPEDFRPDWIER
jgi:SAM-dependent methyltransferase